MNIIYNKTKGFILSNKWWSILIVIVVFFVIYFVFVKGSSTPIVESFTVSKRNLTEMVSVTGKVEPISNVDLTFEKAGRVTNLSVSVGDKVYRGQYLVSVSNGDLQASVEQAKAAVKIAEANLSALNKGSTPEQIALDEVRVQKSQADLTELKNTLVNSINDSYTKADDTIRNKTDIILSNPRNQNVELKFYTDFQLGNDIKMIRPEIEKNLDLWVSSMLGLNSNSNLDSIITIAKNNLDIIQTYLEKVAYAVNNLNADFNHTQTTIDLWKSNISIARSNVDLAVSGLSTNISQYSSAMYSLKIAENQLAITKSGATKEQMAVQEATVEQAKANLDNAVAQLEKSILRSPIDGIVTKVNIKIGELAQAGVPSISLISLGKFEIESFVPEADIAKIKIGNMATTTLDAYGPDTFFDTSVTKIDPAETIIDGIPTYKVTLTFVNQDERIRSGMTANLDILTAQRNNALAIPTRATYTDGPVRYVDIVSNVDDSIKTTKNEIKTGIRSFDGYLEVLSGLKEGDVIVASPGI
jgi:multidrug efflux pump subunit AcrA (membrane-fusion protein)